MHIKHLEYFIQVAECGSISKAAHALYLKPSNLSKCIANLEEEFDTTLFCRSSKGVTLTDDGEEMLAWAKNLLQSQQNLLEHFALHKKTLLQTRGHITLYLPATINDTFHFDLLNAFTQKYPQIILTTRETSIKDALQSVTTAQETIAIAILNDSNLQDIHQQDALIFIATGSPRLVVYTAKDSAIAQKYHSLSIKTLLGLPAILYTPASAQTSPIAELLSDYGVLNIANQTSNVMLFHSMLATGKYIAIGLDAPTGMSDYTAIPIRDKLNLHTGLLFSRSALSNPLNAAFILFYLNYLHQPIPDYLPPNIDI